MSFSYDIRLVFYYSVSNVRTLLAMSRYSWSNMKGTKKELKRKRRRKKREKKEKRERKGEGRKKEEK